MVKYNITEISEQYLHLDRLEVREIGRGHAAIETFCGLVNMLTAMKRSTYQVILFNLHATIKRVIAI